MADRSIKNIHERNYLVVKSNDLIQKSRCMMPLSMQKTFAYICSLIKPDVTEYANPPPMPLEYTFDLRDYCSICGIDTNAGGKALSYIKSNLKALADSSFYIELDESSEVLGRWLDEVRIDKKSKQVTVKLGKFLAPFLLDLNSRFTSYELRLILCMKSAYSIRLYEIIKSYENLESFTLTTDEIRRSVFTEGASCRKCKTKDNCIHCDEYKNLYRNYTDLRRRVLDVAIHEIWSYTDLYVHFRPVKLAYSVIAVEFTVKRKSEISLCHNEEYITKELDYKIKPYDVKENAYGRPIHTSNRFKSTGQILGNAGGADSGTVKPTNRQS